MNRREFYWNKFHVAATESFKFCLEFISHESESLYCESLYRYRSSRPEVFWKYAANWQENTHGEERFATLLKSRFGMGVLL